MKEKLFIVKKVFMAKNVSDALRRERSKPVEEVYLDSDWMKANFESESEESKKEIGFKKVVKVVKVVSK